MTDFPPDVPPEPGPPIFVPTPGKVAVRLPEFEVAGAGTTQPNVTVPFTFNVDTVLEGVEGYAGPITEDVYLTPDDVSQFWITYTPHDGFEATNEGTTHIDFPAVPDDAPDYYQGAPRPAHRN